MPSIKGRSLGALGALLVIASLGCAERNEYQAPPPVEVTVALPVFGEMEDTLETDGLVAGTQVVEIRAQVEGRITRIHFEDGQQVEEGDQLFTIDPRSYRAAVSGASADTANLQAQLEFARGDFQRMRQLYEADNVSLQQYEQARQRMRALQAQVGAARAATAGAAVQLDYTKVVAPISGRMSRRMVDRGQLVGAGEPTLLATVVASEDTYVEFSLSQTELLWMRRYFAEHEGAQAQMHAEGSLIRVGLPGEEGFPHVGRLQSTENMLQASTGTLSARGIFENTDRLLMPGLFTRVQLPVGRSEGLAIPEVAIMLDQVGRYVFIANDEGVVERRNIHLGGRRGDLRRIDEGLAPEDKVVIRGIARVRVGSHVDATEQSLEDASDEAEPSDSPPAEETEAGEIEAEEGGDEAAADPTGDAAE